MSQDQAVPASIRLAWGASTDRGRRRTTNEDSFLADHPLFLVADGMGGHEAGEVASAAAISAFLPLVGNPTLSVDEVREALSAAKSTVFAIADALGSGAAGTTLTGVAVTEQGGSPYWIVINLGDSRTYMLTDGVLEQVSVDHSLVQELIESGELEQSHAGVDPRRNVITRAIGAGNQGEADFWLIPANTGERILICSDGLTGELDDAAITMVLLEETGAQDAANRLVHEALLHGGRDNVTVLVVDVLGTATGESDPETAKTAVGDDYSDDTYPREQLLAGG
ncbi:PP2C family protein-serine/threonine phosphatase [Glaciihabitans sp. GrIS 2.15]|uniref:PP2C family protein-serine/threonine phosphatase n=1 Tax=Glaciihabitans sp. GrIS 2.15 TaxID=3071710 RepID=UPI002E0B18E3|nr:serine/threonine protein phosphatase PrpC [Glaciihabitans sp. GrIS 2.15]